MNMARGQKIGRGSNTRRFARNLRIMGLLLVVMMLQACGASGGGSGAAGTSAASSADVGKEAAGSVPAVLNFGYIGTNQLNFPGSVEGWGLYKGIIQEELKKHGITEVKLTGFPNGPDQTESLISGRIDAGNLGDTPAILAKATGANSRLVNQSSTNNISYLIGKKDGPKSIQDLEGKTIAIQKGSFMHRYIVGLLKEQNVKDYKLVHMLRADAEPALARGDIDAMTNTGVYALKQIAEGYAYLDDARNHPHLIGSSVTVVSEAYLAKFPDFPKVWNEARRKALEDARNHEEEYYQFLAEVNGTTVDIVKEVSPLSEIKDEPFTDEGLQLLEDTKKFLVEEKLAKSDFDLRAWIAE